MNDLAMNRQAEGVRTATTPARRMRILVAYSIASTFVPATVEYLRAIKRHSAFDVDFIHASHEAALDVDFDGYDAVFNNYCVRHCFPEIPSPDYVRKLKAYRGVKVMAVQDEYNRTETLRKAIEEIGFDVVLTCVPQNQLDYVYPRARFPNTRFETVFTGYAPSEWRRPLPYPRMADRPIALGYRGRDIGGFYGRLGYEKYVIGRRMKEICAAAGVAHDIAVDEDSRIYGEAWFDFIGSCRAMLGSESGSNIFDFDGEIERRFHEMTAKAGGVRPSYEEFLPFVEKRESEIDMGQISPRVFECAAMRTAMVLFRGRYSDALEPDLHYIALEKDFSNAAEVLARLEDIPALEAMTQRAYDHLIGSGRFGYRAFVARIDALIEDAATGKQPANASAAVAARGTQIWPVVAPTERPLPALAFHLPALEAILGDRDALEAEIAAMGETTGGEPAPSTLVAQARADADAWAALLASGKDDVDPALASAAVMRVVALRADRDARLAQVFDARADDLARADRGASLAASSAFFPPPNAPEGLLRAGADYAAAMEVPAPHWFVVDLGRAQRASGVAAVFYDRANLVTGVRVLGRRWRFGPWRELASAESSARLVFTARWPARMLREIRFEATAFAGQRRLLLRKFTVFGDGRRKGGTGEA